MASAPSSVRAVREPVPAALRSRASLLYVTQCQYQPKVQKILMRGHNERGETVGLVVDGFKRYLYLQFHQKPADYEAYLRWLQMQAVSFEYFTLPKAGDITTPQRTKNKIYSDDEPVSLFESWESVDDAGFKTLYGWTPGPLAHLIRVYFHQPEACDAVSEFVESQEYVTLVQKTRSPYLVRVFEGKNMAHDMQFRSDRGIGINKWCHVIVDDVPDQPALHYTDREYRVHETRLFPLAPADERAVTERVPVPAMRVLSFDIECPGATLPNPFTGTPQNRFPVPLWSPKAILKNLKEQLDTVTATIANGTHAQHGQIAALYPAMVNALSAIRGEFARKTRNARTGRVDSNVYRDYTDMRPWYRAAYEQYRALEPWFVLPDPMRTDPVIVLVGALDRLHEKRPLPLRFPKVFAIVLEHPRQVAPIDRRFTPEERATESALRAEYDLIELVVVKTEPELVAAFAERVHALSPDMWTGWNIDSFDFTYLWKRNIFFNTYLGRNAYKEHGIPTEFGRPNFGALRTVQCMYSEGVLGRGADEDDAPAKKKTKARRFDDDNDFGGDTDAEDEEELGPSKKCNPARLSAAMKEGVTTPFITHVDGLNVWQSGSFGVKSVFPHRITNKPEYKLDNVASIELTYPGTAIPRRKLEVAHSQTSELWRKGGRDLWFFVCYCYVDATLPILLLEKYSKIQLMVSLSALCNCSMDLIYNNGMQSKIFSLIQTHAYELFNGRYLVPEWGRRALHYPDVWLSASPYAAGFDCHYCQPRPAGMKGYQGALVVDPIRGLLTGPTGTLDFSSLYPSIMNAYRVDFLRLVTRTSMEAYGLKQHEVVPQVLGQSNEIFAGELGADADMAFVDQYEIPTNKTALWAAQGDAFLATVIDKFFAKRSERKGALCKWLCYEKALEIDAASEAPGAPGAGAWTPEARLALVPVSLGEKLGKQRAVLFAAAESSETWVAFVAKVRAELAVLNQNGSDLFALLESLAKTADADQLALKTANNSIYGAMAPGLEGAKLPMVEAAASVTSIGRSAIRMTAALSESQTIPHLRRALVERRALTPFKGMVLASRALPSAGKVLIPHVPDLPEARVKALYEVNHFDSHFVLKGGDTDSVMLGHEKKYMVDGRYDATRDCLLAVAQMVNSSLRGCMSTVLEKIAERMLSIERKNYLMKLLDQRKTLCKGLEIVRGDTLPFVARLSRRIIDNIMEGTYDTPESYCRTVAATVKYIRRELLDFVQGRTSLSDFTMAKKLAKAVYVAKNEHFAVAEKMRQRGKHVSVGDMITFVYARITDADHERLRLKRLDRSRGRGGGGVVLMPPPGRDVAEDVQFAIENGLGLDQEKYWDRIKKPIRKLLRHVIAPAAYPYVPDNADDALEKRIESQRSAVREAQNKVVDEIVFNPIERVLKERMALEMLAATKTNTLFNVFNREFRLVCLHCSTIFTSPDKKQEFCGPCYEAREDLLRSLIVRSKELARELVATNAECRQCVAQAGFPFMPIEDCTKYDCEVFERRARIKVDVATTEHKKNLIRRHVELVFD